MTTINATKGEFVNLINGLFTVQELKGKKFSLTVSKNITILQKELKDLEEFGKPSKEFMDLAQKVNGIANEEADDSKERIDKLESENKNLVKERRAQIDEVAKLMEDEIKLDLHILSEDILPEDITAKQNKSLEKIIE